MRTSKSIWQWICCISLKRALLILMVIGTLVSWILYWSNSKTRSDPLPFNFRADPVAVAFECSCDRNVSFYAGLPSEFEAQFSTAKVATLTNVSESIVLIAMDANRSKAGRQIVETLEYLRLKYKIVQTSKLVQFLAGAKRKRFSLLIIENRQSFDSLVEFDQKFVVQLCVEFQIPMISFFSGKNVLSTMASSLNYLHLKFLTSFQSKVLSIYITNSTDVLRILKKNVTISNDPTKNETAGQLISPSYTWTVFTSNKYQSWIPLAEAIYLNSTLMQLQKSPIVLFRRGNAEWPAQCLFANRLHIWINRLLFVECVGHFLSLPAPTYSLDRFVLVDIDDMFVGARGTRLRPDDVQNLVVFQERMRQLVSDFKLNLGFSGKFYHKGFDEEDFGDDSLLFNSNRFWWFCHTFAHSQPHLFSNESSLELQLRLNKEFALKHNIEVNPGYAVAPHHSGVYPVHESLFEAWKTVWAINVTSTEEYPHLRPARYRRGFTFNGIRVLPRQTCGLYTHTVRLNDYPGGKDKFYRNIFGGELFFQFIFNPVNVFMTHMSNYATDRLAPFAFESVLRMLTCYTNLRFKTRNPTELADRYFRMYPQEQTPLWTNPCNDRRLLDIWSNQERCHRFPSILVVGPQRSGSSALHTFLRIHPSLQPNRASKDNFEELQFFNGRNYLRGISWYLKHFAMPQSGRQLLFEKSANYFDNELTPKRVQSLLPNARILVLLVDPVRRAYSWYQHMRFNRDPTALNYSFWQVLTSNSTSNVKLRNLKSRCVKPGFYAQHLERWLSYLAVQQIVLVDGQRLTTDPASVMLSLQHQLQLRPNIDYRSRLKFSRSKGFYCVSNTRGRSKLNCLGKSKGLSYEMIDSDSRDLLTKLYYVHNQALAKLLNKIGQQLPNWLQESIMATNSIAS